MSIIPKNNINIIFNNGLSSDMVNKIYDYNTTNNILNTQDNIIKTYIRLIIESILGKTHINNIALESLVTNKELIQSNDNDMILEEYLVLDADIQSDIKSKIRSTLEVFKESDKDIPITNVIIDKITDEILQKTSIDDISGDIIDIYIKVISSEIPLDIPLDIQYPSQYIQDEVIDISNYDFDISSEELSFTGHYRELQLNIRRYLDLQCYTIFSNISTYNETPEDRLIRNISRPTELPNYNICSTIDQIKEFCDIKESEMYIFKTRGQLIMPDFDLINVRGNGYCFLNCLYIFTTISFDPSRLTQLYSELSLFRQTFLNLTETPHAKKSINNFIKGMKALAHHYINTEEIFDDETKSTFHKSINDPNIPQTQILGIQTATKINCLLLILITNKNFLLTDQYIECIPQYSINLDTDYCVLIQRNSIHYYLLLPQNNTKENRKKLYDRYNYLCNRQSK